MTSSSFEGGFSDYIVYVDESGDHGLRRIDAGYPMFVLAFCIFEKPKYVREAVPALQELKFKYFGHDMAILHERDIRKKQGDFSILVSSDVHQAFMKDLGSLIRHLPMTVVSVCIDKAKLTGRYVHAENPYYLALRFGLERLQRFLRKKQVTGQARTHVVFEKRGKHEDRELELEFRRVCSGHNFSGQTYPFEIRLAHKLANSSGLQLADLVARPIGLKMFKPDQDNRAFQILEEKLDGYPAYGGHGLKSFP